MSLFADPEKHVAHPPQSWTVEPASAGRWQLRAAGAVLDMFPRKRDAEQARASGRLVELYAKESRWYRGESVAGWKPYAVCRAEAEAVRRRWGRR